jgi:hypothetical protein
LNAPNPFSSIAFLGARAIRSPGSGFLVTESPAGSAVGSMVAWDFGDIAGAPDARMVALWDIDVFRSTTGNGLNRVENIVEYLGGSPAVPIPEPSTWVLLCSGLAMLVVCRNRQRA